MIYRLTAAALALMMTAGIAPHMAAAQDLDIHIGRPDRRPPPPPPGYSPPPGFEDNDDGGPPPRYARGCDPDDAEDAARDMGFRRPHVIDVSPRRIVVEGFTRHGPDRIFFANVRGCPVMRR